MLDMEGKTPAEIAAMTPEPTQIKTPAEIALEGLKTPEEAPVAPDSAQDTTTQLKTPPEASQGPSEAQQEVEPRYNRQLQSLMAKAREAREKQVQSQQYEEQRRELERIQWAKQIGKEDPEVALRALGIERKKLDIAKLLNPDADDEPKSVKELREQVAQMNQYISDLRAHHEQERIRAQQEQGVRWEQNELSSISQFIDSSKDKYEYVGAAKAIGSDKDLYNGMVSMYNQGYSPSYDEMADLVESRIEQLIDLLAPTKKFSDYIGKKFGVQLSRKDAASVTLSEGMKGEAQETVDLGSMTDEENRIYAMKQAYEAQKKLLRRLGQAEEASR